MKINEIIKARRMARNLTQEQIAHYLGVTAPAVTKWEKGASFPDITLLPALARLLETDLNTLLSFQEDLTEPEIRVFMKQLSETVSQKGFMSAYEMAMEQVREYPTCYPLIMNVALFLDGILMLETVGEEMTEKSRAATQGLYERVAAGDDGPLRTKAQSMLIARYMNRQEYDKAEALLAAIPDPVPVEKKQIQANLLLARNRLQEAGALQGERLFTAVNEIHGMLVSLMEVAVKEERIKDAEEIAEISRKAAELFGLWEYNSYLAHFQLYLSCRNREKCLEILPPMLRSLSEKWDRHRTPLYRQIADWDIEKVGDYGLKMRKMILSSLCTDEEAAFLRESAEFQALVAELGIMQ